MYQFLRWRDCRDAVDGVPVAALRDVPAFLQAKKQPALVALGRLAGDFTSDGVRAVNKRGQFSICETTQGTMIIAKKAATMYSLVLLNTSSILSVGSPAR